MSHPPLSTQMSASSRSKRNSKAPVLFEGGDIILQRPAQNLPLRDAKLLLRKRPINPVELMRPNMRWGSCQYHKPGTSTFFLLTLIQLELCERDAIRFPFQIVCSSFQSTSLCAIDNCLGRFFGRVSSND